MITFKQKLSYLLDSTLRVSESKHCPYCKSDSTKIIDRKFIVTTLLECNNCHLYFRHPYETQSSNSKFYQIEYKEKDNLTTELPSPEELKHLIKINFNTASNKNADRLIKIFEALCESLNGKKIIDYGASWGYISYQLKSAGLDVQSFEISKPRAAYGNNHLGLSIVENINNLAPGVDIFFSSHVIEHVPSIQEMIGHAKDLTAKNGYFIALCPNGSAAFRASQAEAFHRFWGKVHPNLLSGNFYKYVFKDNPYYIGSNPINYEAIKSWDKNSQIVDSLSGEELLIIARLT